MNQQIIIRGLNGRSTVLNLPNGQTVSETCLIDIQDMVASLQNIPARLQRLTFNGKHLDTSVDSLCKTLQDFHITETESVVHLSIKHGLLGGKGGFGALLRAQAKQAGKKKTTDFGACRDLSGRRLRHVNDEKILQQWKDAQDRGESYDPAATSSGIENWFLPLPTWADGIKSGDSRRLMKSRRKTEICKDWTAARRERLPPKDAPVCWGCPRGARCEFAHGEDELRGEGAKVMVEEKKKASLRREQEQARDQYFGVINAASRGDDEIADLVAVGLHAAKRAKREAISDAVSSSTTPTPTPTPTEVLLHTINGDLHLEPSSGEIEGTSDFGTAVLAVSIPATSGGWYFEAELLTSGVMQMGWACAEFACHEPGDGVGDDAHSWSFDGSRRAVFHGDEDANAREFGGGREAWKQGDVVGCSLSLRGTNMKMGYSINGVLLGVAHSTNDNTGDGFFPAFSLEDGEALLVNLGQYPFQFPPADNALGADSGPFKAVLESIKMYSAPAPQRSIVSAPAPRESSPTQANPSAASNPSPSNPEETSYEPTTIEDDMYNTVESLMELGASRLKFELVRRNLKSGGTVLERASRLHAVRGLQWEQIDKKLKNKSKN